MLYNSKWESENKIDPRSMAGLTAWLEGQPLDKSYRYDDPFGCLIFQYFRAAGFDMKSCGRFTFSHRTVKKFLWVLPYRVLVSERIPEGFNYVAASGPWTFGAASERAQECV